MSTAHTEPVVDAVGPEASAPRSVIAQHVSPVHASALVEGRAKGGPLPIVEATHGVRPSPLDHVLAAALRGA